MAFAEFSKLNFKFIVIYISISSLPMHYFFIERYNRMEPDAEATVVQWFYNGDQRDFG